MKNTITDAIEESVIRNRIVTIEDPTSVDIEALKNAADDWEKNGPIIEFWGKDEDGDDWRVHVATPINYKATS